MKKQLIVAMVCVISCATYNIVRAAAKPGEISSKDVPAGWVEVRWANCDGPDNVKHFKVGTTIKEISTIFSIFKKSLLFTVSINGEAKDPSYPVQERDYGVVVPGFIRSAGGKPVE